MKKLRVLVIVGPTASGKSDLAVKIAKKFNGEIISADSRQVYKGLDIGTGKITKKEMSGIPHHLLDVVNPKNQFSVSDFKKLAEESLREIASKKKLPIIVGGTGFYIDAVTGRTGFSEVPPNRALRNKLSKRSAQKLFELLKKKDPARAKTIDRHNKVRLIRALEIVDAFGKVIKVKITELPYQFIYIGINLQKKDLEKRIYARLVKRMPGIIREVKMLRANGLSWKRMYELGLEYRYVSLFVRGKAEKKEMLNKLYAEIRHYAMRQMTWFNRNKNIIWFKSPKDKEIIALLSSATSK